MKNTLFTLLLISSLTYSQVEKKLGEFNKVTSFDKIDVTLIQGTENTIILHGDKANEVEVVNKNGELKIRMPFGTLLKGDNISATVYFKNLEALEANEGSRIASQETIKALNFGIIVKEGSEIKVKLNVEKLTIKGSAGSKLYLEGSATNQDILISSGAVLKADKLISKQTVITVNAGGEAVIHATDFVDAKVRAGGTILIHGKPKQINQKTIAGGSIEQVK
jgi:hypothetical protein